MDIRKSIANLNKFEKCLWGGSVLIVVLSFLITGNNDWTTLTTSLIGVTSLIFIAKGDVLGQILIIVFSVIYAIVSYGYAYYGEMITCLGMTTPIAMASIITWVRNPYGECEVKISRLTKKSVAVLVLAMIMVTWGFYYILMYFDTANLIPSTISIATSFLASSLMMMRSPYYALAYGGNDSVLIVLWLMASLENMIYIPMVVCFVIFFINDMYGFINWNRMKKSQAE